MDKWLQSRTALQLISLFLAVILWFVVNSSNQPVTESPSASTTRIEVSPKVYYDDEQFELTEGPGEVIVSVQGKSLQLTQIWMAQKYEVYVDLTNYSAGTHSVPVQTKGFPNGVTVEVIPSEITVTLEDVQRKEVNVIPQLFGEPADGYKAGVPVIKPNKVIVKGSNGVLETIDSVKAYIDVTGLEKDFNDDVVLRVFDKSGKEIDVEVSPAVVEIVVPITSPFIKVPLKIDFSNELPAGISIASITQNFNEVTVYGPKNVVEALEFYQGPKIDLSTIKDDSTFTLQIPIRENISSVDPQSVEIKINVEPSVEKTIANIPVQVMNTAGEGQFEWISPDNGALELTFIGADAILDDLALEDIQASIDVSSLPAGEHEVSVQLSLPNYISVKGSNPTVRVKISNGSTTQQSDRVPNGEQLSGENQSDGTTQSNGD